MIHYHGMSGMTDTVAHAAVGAGHGLVSFAYPEPLGAAIAVCQSFALDNGAYTIWRSGKSNGWSKFHELVESLRGVPNFDFAIIPDRIDGSEAENDRLLNEWPWTAGRDLTVGAPVWHPHESLARLKRLAKHWPRICLGGSPDFRIGSGKWWSRIGEAMNTLCDDRGIPRVKIHGLRLLDPAIVKRIPFASADSTNISRNIKFDSKWGGGYRPISYETRAKVLRERIEAFQPPSCWEARPTQRTLIA